MAATDDDDPLAVRIGSKILASMDEEFEDAPDRVVAILGGAYLDILVDQLLRAAFVNDDKEAEKLVGIYGPLGANGSRCRLAYCLGLISAQERDDLAAIAKIRNAFAHKYDVASFDHVEPSEYIRKLHVGKQFEQTAKELLARSNDPLEQAAFRDIAESGPRKFRETVFNLFATLVRKLDTVKRASPTMWYRPERVT